MTRLQKKTLTVMKRYARLKAKNGYWDWEGIANEIREKNLDYNFYESYFTLTSYSGATCYDWINGNKKWQELIEIEKLKLNK